MKHFHPITRHQRVLFIGTAMLVTILCVTLIFWTRQRTQQANLSKEEDNLSITFLDAGKADAILLRTNDSVVLIDTGLKSDAKDFVKSLQENEIDTIDYMILTHFDKDHVGGAARVIDQLNVNHIITSDYLKDSKEVEDYLEECEDAKITPQVLEDTLTFTLNHVIYTIYPHIAALYPEQESNNTSLIVSVEHQDNRMLFIGDATDLRIQEFLNQQVTNTDYQLLKVPYHGHYMECLAELVNVIHPNYAIITSSKDEKEDEETVLLFEEANAKVLLTRDGTFSILSNGKTLSVE